MDDDRAPDELLAQEREAKFRKWLQNKTLRDKAFEYLDQISPVRAEAKESLVDVAISLRAVERLLGGDDASGEDGGDSGAAQGKSSQVS